VRYILYQNKRHPAEMGAADIEDFLTYLAKEGYPLKNQAQVTPMLCKND